MLRGRRGSAAAERRVPGRDAAAAAAAAAAGAGGGRRARPAAGGVGAGAAARAHFGRLFRALSGARDFRLARYDNESFHGNAARL